MGDGRWAGRASELYSCPALVDSQVLKDGAAEGDLLSDASRRIAGVGRAGLTFL